MHTWSRPASLPALTGMRFCAAAVFVASHFFPGGLPAGDIGAAAVTLFFLLSGFILTCTARPGRVSVRDFYVARFARIYPAYLLSLTLAALLPHLPSNMCPVPSSALLPDLFALQAWLPD